MHRHEYNQFYYTAASDLFNVDRKMGLGIYGSSTPNDYKKNDEMDKFAKELIPMSVMGENAFPVKYVFYRNGKYITGGAITCDALIEMEGRPNVWVHVLEPTGSETESFEACLYANDFHKKVGRKSRILLPVCEKETESLDDIEEWEKAIDKQELAAFLMKVLDALDRKKVPLIFTDNRLKDIEFQSYMLLSEKIMKLIYHLTGGDLRKRLNYIAPVIHTCFAEPTEHLVGARFYFGTKKENCEKITVGEKLKFEGNEFQKNVLLEMLELFENHYEEYAQIGNNFVIRDEATYKKEDYLWQYAYWFLKNDRYLPWKLMTAKDYKEALLFMTGDENDVKIFLKLTRRLLNENRALMQNENVFYNFCSILKRWETKCSEELLEEIVRTAVIWITMFPTLDENYKKLHTKMGVSEKLIERIQNEVELMTMIYDEFSEREIGILQQSLLMGMKVRMSDEMLKKLEDQLRVEKNWSVQEIYQKISSNSDWGKKMKLLRNTNEDLWNHYRQEMTEIVENCFESETVLLKESKTLKKIADIWDSEGSDRLWERAKKNFQNIVRKKIRSSKKFAASYMEYWDEEFVEIYKQISDKHVPKKHYEESKNVSKETRQEDDIEDKEENAAKDETEEKHDEYNDKKTETKKRRKNNDITNKVGILLFKNGGLAGTFFMVDKLYAILRTTGDMNALVLLFMIVTISVLWILCVSLGKIKLHSNMNTSFLVMTFSMWLSLLTSIRIVYSEVVAFAFAVFLIVAGVGANILGKGRERGRNECINTENNRCDS